LNNNCVVNIQKFKFAVFGCLSRDSLHLMTTYIMRLIYGFINHLGEDTCAVIIYNIANSFLIYCTFLGAFANLRKATVSFVKYDHPPARLSTWNNSPAIGQILMKFVI
jgi:hypothetical protein